MACHRKKPPHALSVRQVSLLSQLNIFPHKFLTLLLQIRSKLEFLAQILSRKAYTYSVTYRGHYSPVRKDTHQLTFYHIFIFKVYELLQGPPHFATRMLGTTHVEHGKIELNSHVDIKRDQTKNCLQCGRLNTRLLMGSGNHYRSRIPPDTGLGALVFPVFFGLVSGSLVCLS